MLSFYTSVLLNLKGVKYMENKSKQFSNVFIFASVIVGLLVIIGAIFLINLVQFLEQSEVLLQKRLVGTICYLLALF